MALSEGLNKPLMLKYDELVHLPTVELTVICTADELLQKGPAIVISGIGGLYTDTVILRLSGHKVGFGEELVL